MVVRRISWSTLAVAVAAFVLVACGGDEPTQNPSLSKPTSTQPAAEPEKPERNVVVPDFSADSSYAYIDKQVQFGPRIPNTKGHVECGDWMIEKLLEFGMDTVIQHAELKAYTGEMLKSRNIIGQYKPDAPLRIAFMAHWDTRPYADRDTKNKAKPIDGANDAGSGVGVLLELARAVNAAEEKPLVGFDVIFFDAEDYGQPSGDMGGQKGNTWCLGSQHWSRNPPIENYNPRYAILLDMVGAKGAVFPKEGNSMEYAGKYMNRVWAAAKQLGHDKYFVEANTPGITDDHVYVNILTKIPTLDIVHFDPQELDFGPFHHRHTDNMELIDPATLDAVGETLLHVLYHED